MRKFIFLILYGFGILVLGRILTYPEKYHLGEIIFVIFIALFSFFKLTVNLVNNDGYETQKQKRFKPNDIVVITTLRKDETPYKVGEIVTILENGRHDYLVINNNGLKSIVYQFELKNKE